MTIPITTHSPTLEFTSTTVDAAAVIAKLTNVRTLLVIEGQNISDFANQAILKSAELLCQVPAHKCSLYVLPDSTTAVLHSGAHDLMAFGLLVELFAPLVGNVARFVTISVEPAVAYKTTTPAADVAAPCFLRQLKNGDANAEAVLVDNHPVAALTAPNMLTGIAAGVVSWCKFADRPTASYAAYANERQMNSLTSVPILRLLHALGIPCESTYALKSTHESNLYT